MHGLVQTYDPHQGPAFGQLTREDISKVVKKEDVDVVIWSLGKRPKVKFQSKALLGTNGAVKAPNGAVPAPTHTAPTSESSTHAHPQDHTRPTTLGNPLVNGTTPSSDAVESNNKDDSIVEEAPALPAAPPKPKSWAELLRSKNPASATAPVSTSGPSDIKSPDQDKALAVNAAKFDGIADVLHNFKPVYTSALIQPRGLVNNGNMCFMNAILQPLLHCPPFYNLLTQIGKHVVHSFKSSTPLVDSLIMFLNEFHATKKNQPDYGPPFVPEYVYDALRGLKRFDSMRGRQEDCQEFLGFLLDGLHEEFFAAMKDKPKGMEANGFGEHDDSESGVSEDEWMEVTGPKNKSSHTRSTQFSETPISTIFSGQLRSILRIPTQKDSVTLEPFQSLQLDLTPDNVFTIEDALLNSTIPEVLDGFTSAERGGITVEAQKKIFIEHVPPVLVLHLKRFIYKDGGTQKLHKEVGYKTTLNLQPEIISPARRPSNPIPYKLFGVVYHHGRNASGGHYTCDVLRQNAEWLHIDDTNISVISEADVTVDVTGPASQHAIAINGFESEAAALASAIAASTGAASKASEGVAYVLFYIRSDAKTSAQSSGASTPTLSQPTLKSNTGSSLPSYQKQQGQKHSAAWSVSKK